MMRVVNLLLIVAAVAALGFGGYWVGHAVWQEGEDNRRAVAGSQTTAAATLQRRSASPDTRTSDGLREVLLVGAATGVVAAMILLWGGSNRPSRAESWHA
jgi:hypothetical protein